MQAVLRSASRSWNDRVQACLSIPHRLAPTFPEAEVVKPPRFNAYYGIEEVKPVDIAELEAGARRARRRTSGPGPSSSIYALPEQDA